MPGEHRMNNAAGHRHRNTSRPRGPDRKRAARMEEKVTGTEPFAHRLLVFTLDAHTARIVTFETIDDGGDRRALSPEEQDSVAHEHTQCRIEQLIEQAFEAGIACALQEDPAEPQVEGADESDDDRELRHLLQSEAPKRAIFGTLIQHAIEQARGTTGRAAIPAPPVDGAPAKAN